jgi:hypothetical protein
MLEGVKSDEYFIIHCWWECKLLSPLMETVWRFFKYLKIELLYDPAIPLLGTYLKEYKSAFNRDFAHPYLQHLYPQ